MKPLFKDLYQISSLEAKENLFAFSHNHNNQYILLGFNVIDQHK